MGSVCFLASRISMRKPQVRIRLRILPVSRKDSDKTRIFTVLRLLYDFLSVKNYVNVPVYRIWLRIRIRIRRIRMLLGLPDPDPLVRVKDLRIWIRTNMLRISTKMLRIHDTASLDTVQNACKSDGF